MNDSKILKVIRSEVGVVITIVTIATGIIFPYFGIKQDIALIQKDIAIINTNHEAHIQDIVFEIKEMKDSEKEISEKLDLQQQAIIKLMERIK